MQETTFSYYNIYKPEDTNTHTHTHIHIHIHIHTHTHTHTWSRQRTPLLEVLGVSPVATRPGLLDQSEFRDHLLDIRLQILSSAGSTLLLTFKLRHGRNSKRVSSISTGAVSGFCRNYICSLFSQRYSILPKVDPAVQPKLSPELLVVSSRRNLT